MNNILLLSAACAIITAALLFIKAGKIEFLAQRLKLRIGVSAGAAAVVLVLCLQVLFAVIFVLQAAVLIGVIALVAFAAIRIRGRLKR
jgi:hypothetical protein